MEAGRHEDESGTEVIDGLQGALLESRERWRDLVSVAADLAFEVDAQGRFAFLAPEAPLGWSAAKLIGTPAEALLAETDGLTAFNPFSPLHPLRRRRAWLRRPDGGAACLVFASAPMRDQAGSLLGARGVGFDMTEVEAHQTSVATLLRRGETLNHILWCMNREMAPERMLGAVLDAVRHAVGADGLCLLHEAEDAAPPQVGPPAEEVMAAARALLGQGAQTTTRLITLDGRRLLACAAQTRIGERSMVALWRHAVARAWDEEDVAIAEATAGIVRTLLEHAALQREVARQARTDGLTGLLNRRAFLDEIGRRIERLDREGLPCTLLFADLDRFKDLNDSSGHEVGDEALVLTATVLRDAVRPADLVARLGGDEFAIFLDGADELTAAERAEALRLRGVPALGRGGSDLALSLSIGIACRRPGGGEEIDSLIRRADLAMYEVKRAGRGHWRVAREEPTR